MVSTRGVKFKFSEGERVLCYEPDTTKARVLYDSKVLELNVSRDNKGRKVPEYLIHFYGWSSSWDRCVKEEFILPDTEENRILQGKLATDAALSLKNRRKVKLPFPTKDIAKSENAEEVKEQPQSSAVVKTELPSSSSSSESSDEEVDRNVVIQIPAPLKLLLEEDWYYITQKDKVIKLPCEMNVVAILEGYVKYMANQLITSAVQKKMRNGKEFTLQNAEDKIHLCKEVMDGIRIYFDFTLPHLLLYCQEKKQFYTVGNTCVPICKFKSDKTECKNGAIKIESSDSLDPVQQQQETSSKVTAQSVSKSSGRNLLSTQKSPTSDDSSPTQKVTERARQKKRFRELGSRQGLRSSDKSKSSEDDSTITASNSNISGPESDNSPTRPESPPVPTSPPRQTRHSSQNLPVSPPPSSNKSPVALKRGTSIPVTTSSLCQQVLTVCISNINSPSTPPPLSTPVPKVESQQPKPQNNFLQNEISAWRMLPQYLYGQVPAAPSLIYGGQHLLRLFVKLPELIYKTRMHQKKLNLLLNTLENFLQYLVDKKDELFVPCYIDSCEESSDANSLAN